MKNVLVKVNRIARKANETSRSVIKKVRRTKGGGLLEFILVIAIVLVIYGIASGALTTLWNTVTTWLAAKSGAIFK